MKKILIIGIEVHAIRYIETFILLNKVNVEILCNNYESEKIAEKYMLKKIKLNTCNFESYFAIFITQPLKERLKTIKKIAKSQFHGYLLLEKPLELDYEKANDLLRLMVKMKPIIVYNRQFECHSLNYSDLKEKTINIIWPNLSEESMNPIINTMSNVYDLIFLICGNCSVDVKKVNSTEKEQKIVLEVGDSVVTVFIYDTNDLSKKPIVNNNLLEWPNFFVTNSNILSSLLNGTIDEEKNIQYAMQNVSSLEKIVKFKENANDTK